MLYFHVFKYHISQMCSNASLSANSLTLSVREPHLCLCKQVGSRPAARNSVAGLRSNLFATQSIIPNKKQEEFKGFKKQTTI